MYNQDLTENLLEKENRYSEGQITALENSKKSPLTDFQDNQFEGDETIVELAEKYQLERDEQDVTETTRFIQLKKGVSWLNSTNILFTYFISISQIVFFDLCLVYLLKNENYFNVPADDVASTSANIVFFSQPFTLLFDILLGYMHDKIGRKYTSVISTLVCTLAFALLPFIKSVYPGLLMIRIMLNFSMKGPMTAPLTADYVVSSTRGKATAFTGLGAGFGAIFAVFVLFTITKKVGFATSFFIAAVVYLLCSLWMLITLKDVKKDMREDSQISAFFSWDKLKETSKAAYKVSMTSAEVNLSYYGSFVTRMGDILCVLFMNVWIASFYGSSEEQIDEADTSGQMISGIGGCLILILCFFVGWGTDKMKFVYTVTIYYGIRALFYFLILFARKPGTPEAFIFFLIVYACNGLLNIIMNAYFYKVIRKVNKGFLSGVFFFFGTLGVLLISKLGALMFDYVHISGPFLLGAAFDLSFIILFLIFHKDI